MYALLIMLKFLIEWHKCTFEAILPTSSEAYPLKRCRALFSFIQLQFQSSRPQHSLSLLTTCSKDSMSKMGTLFAGFPKSGPMRVRFSLTLSRNRSVEINCITLSLCMTSVIIIMGDLNYTMFSTLIQKARNKQNSLF